MTTCRVATAACLASVGLAEPVAAQIAMGGGVPQVVVQGARVRGLGSDGKRLLALAVTASPTVAQMVADLEQTDLIVLIDTARLPRRFFGQVRFLGGSPGLRYLHLSLGVPSTDRDLLAVLGHELRHAVEIAEMPDVRDDQSLALAYQRIGRPVLARGCFETDAALATGHLVTQEVAAYFDTPHR